jgi:hypothetical protein
MALAKGKVIFLNAFIMKQPLPNSWKPMTYPEITLVGAPVQPWAG